MGQLGALEVFIFLSIARFILGVGVGGVYPLAATVAAEGSSSRCPGCVAPKWDWS